MLSNKSSKNTQVSNTNESEILTLMEVCEILKVHPNTLRQWDRKKILVPIRFGVRKDRKYKKSEILKFLDGK